MDKIFTISHKEFKGLNCLSVVTRFEQCVISIVFKSIYGNCPYYLNEVFEFVPKGNVCLRNNFLKLLKRPFRNTSTSQKALPLICPLFWNQIPDNINNINSKTDNITTFNYNLKKHFYSQITWFLLTLPLLLIILFIIITSSNIIIIITTIIAIIIILLSSSLVLLLSSVLLLLFFSHYSLLHFYYFCWGTTLKIKLFAG